MVSFYINDTILQASCAVALWVPDRQDVIWIDCNPQAGREMRDVHPFLVLCHQPKTFDWRVRQATPHPMKRLPEAAFQEVCGVLNQIIALA